MQTHEHSEPLFDGIAHIPAMDICIDRARYNPESIDACPTVDAKRESHQKILELFADGDWTGKEISTMLGVPFNACSGRLSELRALGKLTPTGERRDKGAVLTLKTAEVTV